MSTSFKFRATSFTVATKTVNLWKLPESTQNHLQAPKTIHNHPKPSIKNICNHPKPTITTQSHPKSARIYIELFVTGLQPPISMWKQPQLFKKHLRAALVFMWNAHYGKSSISVFQKILASINKIFISGGRLRTKHDSMMIWHFRDISLFPKILSLKLFGNSWGNSYMSICSTIKKSQNIMNMMVCKIFFYFLCFY